MSIILVGLNQKTAPVEIREQLAMPPKAVKAALSQFHFPNTNFSSATEIVILSTCNRLEVYAINSDPDLAKKVIFSFLEDQCQISQSLFRPYIYNFTDDDAIKHLFSVASGLDSMILGEDQILGQVTEAMETCLNCGTTGKVLSTLFRSAITTGKRVRNETSISHGATSVSHVAVELAQRIFGALNDCNVLLVGADEMAQIAARTLSAYGVKSMSIINRTSSTAQHLASEFNARYLEWDQLDHTLNWADIVITATGAPYALFHTDNVRPVMASRRNRPLFFIDIAVPRNVDSHVDQLEGVFRYDIDDLQSVVQASLADRQREVPKAEKIVEEQYQKFLAWYRSLDVVPTIIELRENAECIRQIELERALNHFDDISDQEREILEIMSERIVNKILHTPTIQLKYQAEQSEGSQYIEIVRDLFGLNGKGESK